ncbi:TPA: DUF551 domain-containing protein [Salmonella enterica]
MNTLTKEEVQAVSDLKAGYALGHADVAILQNLTHMLLASLNATPIYQVQYGQQWRDVSKEVYEDHRDHGSSTRIVYAEPPAPVVNEFIPKNLDRALGVVGVALPESREEFNFQTERWIQRLIDRVIRYADEFKEQPAPVVPFYRDGIEAAASWVDKQRQAFDNEHGRYDSDTGAFEFGNDAQRDYSDTLAELADGIRELHPNAGDNSPVTPDGWINCSERMPEIRQTVIGWNGYAVRQCVYTRNEYAKTQKGREPRFETLTGIWHGVTHWMPLPEPPQK